MLPNDEMRTNGKLVRQGTQARREYGGRRPAMRDEAAQIFLQKIKPIRLLGANKKDLPFGEVFLLLKIEFISLQPAQFSLMWLLYGLCAYYLFATPHKHNRYLRPYHRPSAPDRLN